MVFIDLSTTLTYCDSKTSTSSGYVENLSIDVVDNKIICRKVSTSDKCWFEKIMIENVYG